MECQGRYITLPVSFSVNISVFLDQHCSFTGDKQDTESILFLILSNSGVTSYNERTEVILKHFTMLSPSLPFLIYDLQTITMRFTSSNRKASQLPAGLNSLNELYSSMQWRRLVTSAEERIEQNQFVPFQIEFLNT